MTHKKCEQSECAMFVCKTLKSARLGVAVITALSLIACIQSAQTCPKPCVCIGMLVDCSARRLNRIPTDMPRNATMINLNRNRISRLDKNSFNDMPKLQILSISNNRITKVLPKAFAKLPKLKSLDVSMNMIHLVHRDAFVGAHQLATVSLTHNNIASLYGSLNKLPQLGSLMMAFNRLKRVTANDFQNNTQLRLLDISDNKIAKVNPNSFKNLRLLRYLIIKNNPLVLIPEMDFGESNLQLIDFTNCQLKSIPRILPETVTDLRLGKNTIKLINGSDISHIKRLQLLTLNDNQINLVVNGSLARLDRLEELWLNMNNLVNIPWDLPLNLRKLTLDHNMINIIQPGIFQNTKLEYISVQMNHVAEIEYGALHDLPNLKQILLNANRITNLTFGTFVNMTGLEHISLSNNILESIEDGAFAYLPNMRFLDISFASADTCNIIQNILLEMPEIVQINLMSSPCLAHNILKKIQEETPEPLLNVTEFNLMYNNLARLPPEIEQYLPNVEHFYLDGNPWNCSTNLRWLKDWMDTRNGTVSFYQAEESLCEKPYTLRGIKINNITREMLPETRASKYNSKGFVPSRKQKTWYFKPPKSHSSEFHNTPSSAAKGSNNLSTDGTQMKQSKTTTKPVHPAPIKTLHPQNFRTTVLPKSVITTVLPKRPPRTTVRPISVRATARPRRPAIRSKSIKTTAQPRRPAKSTVQARRVKTTDRPKRPAKTTVLLRSVRTTAQPSRRRKSTAQPKSVHTTRPLRRNRPSVRPRPTKGTLNKQTTQRFLYTRLRHNRRKNWPKSTKSPRTTKKRQTPQPRRKGTPKQWQARRDRRQVLP